MDKKPRKRFAIVSSVGVGAVGGVAVATGYEAARASLVAKKLSAPHLTNVISNSLVDVPLAIGFALYTEIKGKKVDSITLS